MKPKKKSRKQVNLFYKSRVEDEKYFCFDGDSIPGSACYYTNDKAKFSDNVRFIGKEKNPKKIFMWITISNRSMSKPYFHPSKLVAGNTDIYVNECFQSKLLPFIKKHHGDFNYQVWSD